MLPRKFFSRAALALVVIAGGFVVGNPSFAAIVSKPSVSTSEIQVDTVTEVSPGVYQLVAPQEVDPFTLVGVTWSGTVSEETTFQVRIREEGTWTQWYSLNHHGDHEADEGSAEEALVLGGTDPLLTGPSDAIEVQMLSNSPSVPADLKISLIDSRVTVTDKMIANGIDVEPQIQTQGFFGPSVATYNYPPTVTSANGAIVTRPNMVTRAEWGADESYWRGPIRHGSGIVAGFVHHTVNTNNYTADQVPGMLRDMFVYFTTVRGYADLPYNFLIDKFGTIYEGRRGCAPGTDATCDGPSMPNQGAHTAGFNPNTFAVSAIGSYHLSSAAPASVLVDPIAQLFAWKFAPYGVDPLGNTTYTTFSPGDTGRWPAGTTVTIPSISGHRDVGVTACPGGYLYDYVPAIRNKASEILAIAIQDVTVSPTLVGPNEGSTISVSATIPANSTWVVDVRDPNGNVIEQATGTQATKGPITYTWNKPAGLAPGRYSVNINATFTPPALSSPSPTPTPTVSEPEAVAVASVSTNQANYTFAPFAVAPIRLQEKSTQVIVAGVPSAVSDLKFIRVSSKATKIKWTPVTTDLVNASSYAYRYSTNGGRSWSGWTDTNATEATLGGWAKGKTWQVQVVAKNFVGASTETGGAYKAGAVAAKPRVPNIAFTRLSGSSTRISWSPSKSDKLPVLTSYYRFSTNNGKSWSAWTATGDRQFVMTGLAAKKKYRVQVKLVNDVGTGSARSTSFIQKR